MQFRLHQIVEAPEQERDTLLKKLEDFADRGIPSTELYDSHTIVNRMDRQRSHQHELIEQLKGQLEDLEKYAYETGEPVLPQSILVEKQKVIIDELKQKINLNFNELDLPQLSSAELRNQVDQAFGEFVSPLKMKEQLVAQLKTQVNDLERFIKFLQGEKCEKKKLLLKRQVAGAACSPAETHDKNCNCTSDRGASGDCVQLSGASEPPKSTTDGVPGTIGGRLFGMFTKASTLLHIFALSQMAGCASPNGLHQQFKKNTLKKTYRGNHWGDVRAKLEVDIQEVLSLCMEMSSVVKAHQLRQQQRGFKGADTEDDDDTDEVFTHGDAVPKTRKENRARSTSTSSSHHHLASSVAHATVSPAKQTPKYRHLQVELVALVRKKLSITLQKLMQHGLRRVRDTKHLVPFISCFANLQMSGAHLNGYRVDEDEPYDYREIHAWELILEYYSLKNGDYYNETPAQKLSQSYNLDISGDCMVSNKQVSGGNLRKKNFFSPKLAQNHFFAILSSF